MPRRSEVEMIRWNHLDEGSTGIDYSYAKCHVCGAPFIESNLEDIVLFPDLGHDATHQGLASLKEHHGIDLTSDTAIVCRSCRHKIDEMLRKG